MNDFQNWSATIGHREYLVDDCEVQRAVVRLKEKGVRSSSFLIRISFGLAALLHGGSVLAEGLQLNLPVRCRLGESCFVQNYMDRDASTAARDYQCSFRTYDGHSGTDFRLPSMKEEREGVDVLAAAPGVVTAVRDGVEDVYYNRASPESNGRECGNGVVISHDGDWSTQYCHLKKGSLRVSRGERVQAGQAIGQVGLSGMTEFPHLHLTVRQGSRVVDPFSPGESGCGMHDPLWSKAFLDGYQYLAGTVINSGFADGPVDARAIEDGKSGSAPTVSSPMLIAYFRWMGLDKGDQLHIVLRAPDGSVLAEAAPAPLEKSRALELRYIGRKRPNEGWSKGTYAAESWVSREGKTILQKSISITF